MTSSKKIYYLPQPTHTSRAGSFFLNGLHRLQNAQYETRLALPDGWKLLSTTSNIIKGKYCFWVAYGHPEQQQIVILYRAQNLQF